jgi:hypothetical protein
MGFSMRHILALTVCAGLLLPTGGRAQSAAPEPGALQGVRAVWVLRTSLRSAASVLARRISRPTSIRSRSRSSWRTRPACRSTRG